MDAQSEDQPIALRRKRRSSAAYNLPQRTPRISTADTAFDKMPPTTPSTRQKKRVRFSDPGPVQTSGGGGSSTGITPFVRRTSLKAGSRSPSPGLSPQRPKSSKSRLSLPTVASSSWFTAAPSSSPFEVQFTPLRQVLDDRVKRRLKRRHLSEEMNDIDSDKKLAIKQEKRIHELETQIKAAAKTNTRLLPNLKVATDDHTLAIGTNFSAPEPKTPSIESTELIADFADEASSPCPTVAFSDDMDYGVPCSSPSISPLEPRTPSPMANVAVQTSLFDASLLTLQQHSETQKEHLIKARMELEHLVPGETALPLSPSLDGDASPLLGALLSHLRSAMGEVSRVQRLLRASESQENKLRSEFNKSLKQFESARSRNELLESNLGKVNEIFLDVKAKARAKLDKAQDQIQHLEIEKQQSEQSMNSLKTALDKYRADVKDMEGLITSMESKHAKMLNKLDKAHEQQLSDLEAHVDAETAGRRDAEADVERLELRVSEVEVLNRELKSAVNQKQKTLRQMESEWEQQRDHLEREVGSLNVRLGEAQARIGELEEQVAVEKRRTLDAIGRVVQGAKVAGEEAVREVVTAENGRISFGLLTPQVDGGRFIDVVGGHVDGRVETGRGKASRTRRHPDSGIGIQEEDQSQLLSSDL